MVRERRLRLNLQQQDLADLLKVEACTISKIEHNKLEGIRLALAVQLAWALRCPLCHLLRGRHQRHTEHAAIGGEQKDDDGRRSPNDDCKETDDDQH